MTGGTNYASEDRIESFLSGQGFLYNVIEDTWNIGPRYSLGFLRIPRKFVTFFEELNSFYFGKLILPD